jgi:hypothetical protein
MLNDEIGARSPLGLLSFSSFIIQPSSLILLPDPSKGSLDLLLEAGDQFPVGRDQQLLGFDLGDDGLLGGEGSHSFSGLLLE